MTIKNQLRPMTILCDCDLDYFRPFPPFNLPPTPKAPEMPGSVPSFLPKVSFKETVEYYKVDKPWGKLDPPLKGASIQSWAYCQLDKSQCLIDKLGQPGVKTISTRNPPSIKGISAGYTIQGTVTYKMPEWTRYDAAPQAQKDEWDRFMKELWLHERGHGLIWGAIIGRGEAQISELVAGGGTTDEAFANFGKILKAFEGTLYSAIIAKTSQLQTAYDEANDHGAINGQDAVLRILSVQ